MSKTRFLSHRLRGFGLPESSIEALRIAGRSRLDYLEIDIRRCADSLVVYHDPKIRFANRQADVSSVTSETMARSGAPKLEEFLLEFESLNNSQVICLDIKDYGYEEELIRMVEGIGLADRTVFISWIPQTILELRRLGWRGKLILSQLNTTRFGRSMNSMLDFVFRDRDVKVGHFVLMGLPSEEWPKPRYSIGFQHGLLSDTLDEESISSLRDNGGLCIHHKLVCRPLSEYCAAKHLELWAFGANNAGSVNAVVESKQVDVCFLDSPELEVNSNES